MYHQHKRRSNFLEVLESPGSLIRRSGTFEALKKTKLSLINPDLVPQREVDVQVCTEWYMPQQGRGGPYPLKRKSWWIPGDAMDGTLIRCALQKMNVVIISEQGILAHF